MDAEGVMRREKSAGGLFTARRYAEICSYDRRSFPSAVVEMTCVLLLDMFFTAGDLSSGSLAGRRAASRSQILA